MDLTELYDTSPDYVTLEQRFLSLFYGMDMTSQKFDLFMWKREIPKRKWRRWRGRVKAGKPIPVWAILFEGTPTGRALPTPFVSPL